ncbi:MAG: amidohydrolase family protein [Candidatus Helarchaeota archaeon]|nr:amidohydrolase family protein [Candidatus Helarchaeota archaeon]
MILIDGHRHLPFTAPSEEAISELLAFFEKYKLFKACIYPSLQADDFSDLNRYYKRLDQTLAKGGNHFAKKILKFGAIDFTKSPHQLEQDIEKHQLKGLKLHPLQNFKINKEVLMPYLEILKSHNLPLYIHSDWVPSTEYKKRKVILEQTIGKIASFVPRIPVIMGHAGNSDSYRHIHKVLNKHSNVILETSMAPTSAELEKAIWKYGAHRVIFGSNEPYCAFDKELKLIEVLNISLPERYLILGKNAMNLFHLNKNQI